MCVSTLAVCPSCGPSQRRSLELWNIGLILSDGGFAVARDESRLPVSPGSSKVNHKMNKKLLGNHNEE